MKIILLLLISSTIWAQNEKSGVYLTFSDYNNNALAFENNCATDKNAIKLNELFNEPSISIAQGNKKIKLRKDSIYGVSLCNQPLTRFQDGEHFHLAEKGLVWIFYKEVAVPEGKVSRMDRLYYFSATGDGKLLDLNADNLKSTFPTNHKLHDMLDLYSQNSLVQYDSFHKKYRVNHFLRESSK